MLSIDEAIEKHKKLKILAKGTNDKRGAFYSAKEHEKLAEWLELLKWYQQCMEDIPSESGVLPKDVYHAGYNKAIDDFVKEICKMIVQSENNGNYRFYAVEIKQAIAELAEQLKEGGENE